MKRTPYPPASQGALTVARRPTRSPGAAPCVRAALDHGLGINMTGSGRPLLWVAVRGGVADWAVYAHWFRPERELADEIERITREGDKVPRGYAYRLVPHDDEAEDRYRLMIERTVAVTFRNGQTHHFGPRDVFDCPDGRKSGADLVEGDLVPFLGRVVRVQRLESTSRGDTR